MPSVLLTDALLRSIKPGEKLIEYWDTRVSGLCLRISPGGGPGSAAPTRLRCSTLS